MTDSFNNIFGVFCHVLSIPSMVLVANLVILYNKSILAAKVLKTKSDGE